MEERRFDALAKSLARPVGRRGILKGIAAAVLGSVVAGGGAEAAKPIYPHAPSPDDFCVGQCPSGPKFAVAACRNACLNCLDNNGVFEHGQCCLPIANDIPVWINGTCTHICDSGYALCGDTCCADTTCCQLSEGGAYGSCLADDPNYCGPSCTDCTATAPANSTATCTAGVCGYTCNGGFKECGEGGCGECCDNTDCTSENCVQGICQPVCVGRIGCLYDTDCSSNESCIGGVCEPTCVYDTDCTSGTCQSGRCVQNQVGGACICTTDCTSGACANGTCVPVPAGSPCIYGGDCNTLYCGGGVCQAVCVGVHTCVYDTDCASNEICVGGVCEPVCGTNADCTNNNCVNGRCEPIADAGPCKCGGDCWSQYCHDDTHLCEPAAG